MFIVWLLFACCLKSFTFCIGHRGSPILHPENTVSSLKGAIEEGVQGVEFDLHLTKDRRIILLHDDTLDRTTDSHGPVSDRNWKGDLEFVRIKHNGKITNQHLPLLEDVLQLSLKHEQLFYMMDIKPTNDLLILEIIYSHLLQFHYEHPQHSLRFSFGLYTKEWFEKLFQLESLNDYIIDKVLITNSIEHAQRIHWHSLFGISMHIEELKRQPEFLEQLKPRQLAALSWTVNTKEEMQWSIDSGIEFLITNYPSDCLQLTAGGGRNDYILF